MLISAIIGGFSRVGYFHFPELPLVGFTLIGVVLSIFLGFKNTACYDRWWEARKLWGILIANARHFDRDCRMLSQGRRERVIQHVIVLQTCCVTVCAIRQPIRLNWWKPVG